MLIGFKWSNSKKGITDANQIKKKILDSYKFSGEIRIVNKDDEQELHYCAIDLLDLLSFQAVAGRIFRENDVAYMEERDEELYANALEVAQHMYQKAIREALNGLRKTKPFGRKKREKHNDLIFHIESDMFLLEQLYRIK